MAIKNTPPSYKCSICGVLGHNARTCPTKATAPSATRALAERRAAKRAIREARKAAKGQVAPADSEPVASVAADVAEAFGMADLPNVIVQDNPTEIEVMGLEDTASAPTASAASDEDAEAMAVLRMLGII